MTYDNSANDPDPIDFSGWSDDQKREYLELHAAYLNELAEKYTKEQKEE